MVEVDGMYTNWEFLGTYDLGSSIKFVLSCETCEGNGIFCDCGPVASSMAGAAHAQPTSAPADRDYGEFEVEEVRDWSAGSLAELEINEPLASSAPAPVASPDAPSELSFSRLIGTSRCIISELDHAACPAADAPHLDDWEGHQLGVSEVQPTRLNPALLHMPASGAPRLGAKSNAAEWSDELETMCETLSDEEIAAVLGPPEGLGRHMGCGGKEHGDDHHDLSGHRHAGVRRGVAGGAAIGSALHASSPKLDSAEFCAEFDAAAFDAAAFDTAAPNFPKEGLQSAEESWESFVQASLNVLSRCDLFISLHEGEGARDMLDNIRAVQRKLNPNPHPTMPQGMSYSSKRGHPEKGANTNGNKSKGHSPAPAQSKATTGVGHGKKAECLKRWYFEHRESPYPTSFEKSMLAAEAGLTQKQVTDWFTNQRKRRGEAHRRDRNKIGGMPIIGRDDVMFRQGKRLALCHSRPAECDGTFPFIAPIQTAQTSPESLMDSTVGSSPRGYQTAMEIS